MLRFLRKPESGLSARVDVGGGSSGCANDAWLSLVF
jgi:hypothetical protein